MQVKKEELRSTILEVAKKEFVKKGYDNSSMRVIAQKANTTIGNIYHYFPSKEAILDELLLPTEQKLSQVLTEHLEMNVRVNNMDDINYYLDHMDLESEGLKVLMQDEIVIFIKTDVEKHRIIRDEFLEQFRKHVAWHLNVKEDNHYLTLIVNMLMECIVHLNKCVSCSKDKKSDIIQVFRMVCSGLIEKNKEKK